MIISISDDALDKDQRESILVDLGLYEEVVDPNEYGGVTIQNQIEYEIQPIIVNNQLIGSPHKTLLSGNLFDFMKKRENMNLCGSENLY